MGVLYKVLVNLTEKGLLIPAWMTNYLMSRLCIDVIVFSSIMAALNNRRAYCGDTCSISRFCLLTFLQSATFLGVWSTGQFVYVSHTYMYSIV